LPNRSNWVARGDARPHVAIFGCSEGRIEQSGSVETLPPGHHRARQDEILPEYLLEGGGNRQAIGDRRIEATGSKQGCALDAILVKLVLVGEYQSKVRLRIDHRDLDRKLVWQPRVVGVEKTD